MRLAISTTGKVTSIGNGQRQFLQWFQWFLLALIVSAGTVACKPCELAPKRDFRTEALLMDESLFPPAWKNTPIIPTADSHGAVEHPSRDVVNRQGIGVAVHEIYRYECVNDAEREYRRQLDVWFPDTPLYDEWLPRKDLRALLAFADEAYLACANRGRPHEEKITNCGMLARYHEYVVRFSTQVVPPYLTFEGLARILKGLDEKFASAMGAGK